MKSDGELSSRAYEREARSTHHRLAASLDELNQRLTPAQVFDEVVTCARAGSGTFVRAVTNAARENPIASLLSGAGCMLFISDKLGLGRFMPSANGSDARLVTGVSSGRGSRTRTAGRSPAEHDDSLADEPSTAAGSRFRDASAYVGGAGATATRARQQAANMARRLKASTTSLANEQPLLCAALGIAVGAALAAALPSTRTEDALLGEASDAVKDRMGQFASEQFEGAKAAAGKAAQAAGTAALREGLSASRAADAACGLGERVRRVVTEAPSSRAAEFRNRAGRHTAS